MTASTSIRARSPSSPGGSRGASGSAIATALHGAGAKVALCGRDGAKAQEVAAELGGAARGYACDMGVAAQIEALAEQVEADFGPVDILVNNAGRHQGQPAVPHQRRRLGRGA